MIRYQETGLMQNRVKAGRPRVTTEDKDFDIILSAIENPFRKLDDIKNHLQTYLKLQFVAVWEKTNFMRVSHEKKSHWVPDTEP